MNEQIQQNSKDGIKAVKRMERNSKNMVAKQQSVFFSSKYQASKLFASMNMSKFSINQKVKENAQ